MKKSTFKKVIVLLIVASLCSFPLFSMHDAGGGGSGGSKEEPETPPVVQPDIPSIPQDYIDKSAAVTEDGEKNETLKGKLSSILNVENIAAVVTETVKAGIQTVKDTCTEVLAVITGTRTKNMETAVAVQAENKAPATADPVRYSTGEYIQTDTDLSVSWGVTEFTFGRNYGIRNTLTGTTGYGWENSLDQRLIIGINNEYREAAEAQKTYAEYLESTRDAISEMIRSRYKVSSVQTAYAEIEGRLKACRSCQAEAKAALDAAESHRSYGNSYSDLKSKANQNYEDAGANYDAITKKVQDYETILAGLPQQVNEYNRILADMEAAEAELERLTALAEQCDAITALNGKTRYPGTPACYYEQGLGTVTTVDEGGSIHTFTLAEGSTAEYVPASRTEHGYLKVCRNEDGTWTAVRKDGTEKTYREDGFLTCETDRYGNRITFERNPEGRTTGVTTGTGESFVIEYSEAGYISSITNSRDPSERVRYAYTGKLLTAVTDADGDTARYEYNEDGIMTAIVKSDGSRITLSHEKREDGTYVTVQTANEEGHAEYLSYDFDGRHTVYTDHDGNRTEYWFDAGYQTVKEISPDGSVRSSRYDEERNLTEVTVNGNTTRYAYDGYGQKVLASYSDGSTKQWSYDAYGSISTYKDRDGVVYEYIRDALGNMTEYRVQGKTAVLLEHDGTGKVARQTVMGNSPVVTDYSYDAYGNLAEQVTDGISTAYRYDSRNRVTAVCIDGILQQTYAYTAKTTTVTESNGLETVYTWNGRKDLVSVIRTDTVTGEERRETYEYDRRHLPVSRYVDGELLSGRRYTPEGRLEAEMTRDEGRIIMAAYSYNGDLVETVSRFAVSGIEFDFYSADLETLKSIAASGGEYAEMKYRKVTGANNTATVYVTDPLDRTTSAGYDPWGNTVSVTDAMNNTSIRAVTGGGRVVSEQSAHGGYYDYDYNRQGLLSRSGERGCNEYVAASYYDDGSIRTVTNRYGEATEYTYNERGLVESVRSAGKTVWYEYDSRNRMISELTGAENNTATAEAYVTRQYSPDGRTVTVSAGNLYLTVYGLNAFGETVSVTDGLGNTRTSTYNSRGQLTASADAYGYTTGYEYTGTGQLSKVTNPDGSFIRYEYDYLGNCILQTDAMGIIWQGTYDAAGRLVAEKGRPGTDREYEYDELDRIVCVRNAGTVTERYSYSDRGRTVTFTDVNGNSYTWEKDAYGRTVSEENRLGGIQEYEYDAEGELRTRKDFNGSVTTCERERGNTVMTTLHADGTISRITYGMTGNIIRAENAESVMTYSYNKAGLLTGQKDELTGEITEYVYDAAGRRVQMKISHGRQISTNVLYKYGKNGELLSENDNIAKTSVTFRYDRNGREAARTFGNGVSRITVYDEAGRVCAVQEVNSRAKLLWGEAYVYDSETGLRTATVSNDAEVTLYEYDAQGRIAAVWYPSSAGLLATMKEDARENGLTVLDYVKTTENRRFSSRELVMLKAALGKVSPAAVFMLLSGQNFTRETFTYDANGNRSTRTTPYGTVMYTYDAENRLVSSGCNGRSDAVVYTYDGNGNMLSRKSSTDMQEYTYNAIDRMVRSTVTDYLTGYRTTGTYGYDSFGRRTTEQRTGNNRVLRTTYDGFTLNGVKEQAGGDTIRTTLYAGSSPVAEKRGITTSYFTTDILGSVRSVTGALGTVTDSKDYDVFGTPLSVTSRINAWYENTVSTSYGYLGKQYDSTTRFYNYGYRDYSPRTGRFTTVDPVRDGNNWYAYVNSDPVNYVDLWGLAPLTQEQENFAIQILGTSINGITIDYDTFNIEYTVADETTLNNLAVGLSLDDAIKQTIILDLQDTSRGTSLPGGNLYFPGTTSTNLSRVVHEIYHQYQYKTEPNALQRVISEQISYSTGGNNPYSYRINNKGKIDSLSDITTIEAQAEYIEDFAQNYTRDKRNSSFRSETKEQARVLINSGIKSKAVCEVNNS